ncbi:MAG: hypothetical protein ABR511_05595 [Acidimicrobiales bacterium]
MSGRPCAAAGCDNVVERHPGRVGRPPIYCSPACRPSRTGCVGRDKVSVEVDQQENDGDGSGRGWVVTLRRGTIAVVVGRDLGRFSATMLSGELRALLQPGARREGDAIE